MAAYHAVLVHFPIALLMTATLAILVRAVSAGPLAQAVDRALVPLMAVGLLAGLGRTGSPRCSFDSDGSRRGTTGR